MSDLVLEARAQQNESPEIGPVILTPALGEDYWSYRVKLSDTQAIVGFPKFFTTGIGFAQEEDWNTNLPYTCGTEEIYEHIAHNKGDDSISREDCISAIRMIQEAVAADANLDADPLKGELDKAREVLAEAGALRSDSSPHIVPSLRALIAELAKLRTERANAYDALSNQGRSAVDVSGNLEDGVDWDQLAHSAEVSGLVEELAAVRGERDRQVERIREEITATRNQARLVAAMSASNAADGNPNLARRERAVADALAERADRFERALNGGEADAG